MYGLLITFSILASALFLEKQLKKEQKSLDTFWGLVFWTVLTGVIGARLYHVLDNFEVYKANPVMVFEVWRGGLGILGGILFGLAGAVAYLKYKKEPVVEWLDKIAVFIPFIQSASRWGNFFNNELYGKETTLPWGIYVSQENAKVHPLFLYESLLNATLFIFLLRLSTKNLKKGSITASYLIGYSIIRLFLEEFKLNPWHIAGLNVAQLISILIILGSIVFLTYELKHKSY